MIQIFGFTETLRNYLDISELHRSTSLKTANLHETNFS